ncbi:MAG: PQQ-dependent sugar dehydrogenase [Pseudobacteriovorax sp.]|nr:PQQ-dependent sugar dehydrogenase [Pseudobacteriovorax sp.]
MMFRVSLLLSLCLATPALSQANLSDFQRATVDNQLPITNPRPNSLQTEIVARNLDAPLFVTHAGDGSGRVFAVSQEGQIWVYNRTLSNRSLFLDVSDQIVFRGEAGLLGLAFAPDFSETGHLYIYYSAMSTGRGTRSVVSRYVIDRRNPNRVNPASEKILLSVEQPFLNHNGGMMAFGPDGYLYIGLGDGGSANDPRRNGQNLGTLLGSVLRIDVSGPANADYKIPSDNPFVNRSGARGEIWAFGIRNPWRFSFDPQTGELWLADVGQDALEEINIIEKGGNYGWPVFEASRRRRGSLASGTVHAPPVFEYPHSQGQSITGGYVYRGREVPELFGSYIYGDFVSGRIWALTKTANGSYQNQFLFQGSALSSFGRDQDGELYIVSYQPGSIRKITGAGSADPVVPLPETLSATGLFVDVPSMTFKPGVAPYEVTSPLWSDAAVKSRFIYVPESGDINIASSGRFSYPTGTIVIKHFEAPLVNGGTKRLETRLLVKTGDDWYGVTYKWNDRETEAFLQLESSRETLEGSTIASWYFPSRTDCLTCHNNTEDRVLGFNLEQLNRNIDELGNQLAVYNEFDYFNRDISRDIPRLPKLSDPQNTNESLKERVSAYLAANCGSCHRPNGPTPTSLNLNFPTDIDDLINQTPDTTDLGIPGSRLIVPGRPDLSILLLRMKSQEEGRMPPLASDVEDEFATSLIEEWILSL